MLGAAGAAAVGTTRNSPGTSSPKQDGPLNFLVLMSDQHSPHVLGCYGDPVVRTPHLDKLAGRGVLFENTYCQAPLCVPSRMSFLTGRQPSDIGVWNNNDTLPSDVSTFAHVLGAAGYETSLIGRMHFLGFDQCHGFEQRLVGDVVPPFPNGKFALSVDMLVGPSSPRAYVDVAGPGRTAYQVYDEQVTDAAVQYLREKGRQNEQPFCAVVGLVLPHMPLVCPKDQWRYYLDRVTIPPVPPGYFEHLHPAIRRWRKNHELENVTDQEIRRGRAGYYGLVTEMDALVGKILDALEETPELAERTVIVYTSDHGEMAGENGLWWKTTFYEGSVKVPLIVSYPPAFKAGQRKKEVVSLMDVGATLVDLARAGPWPENAGTSLVPLLNDQPVNWANEALSEYPPEFGWGLPAERMIRAGEWKLIHYDGMRPQLFNLDKDPHEFNDFGDDPSYSEIREKLLKRALEGWSAERVTTELSKRARDYAIISRWYAKVNPPRPPAEWVAPAGSNVYPEPE